MDNLKQKIIGHLKKYNLAISEFERNAGLSNSIVHKLLDSKAKSPTIETILKIADALDCSLDELFDRNKYLKKYLLKSSNGTEYADVLFRSVCFHILYFIQVNNLKKLSLEQVVLSVEEIYKHCLEAGFNIVDIEFADKFLHQHLQDN